MELSLRPHTVKGIRHALRELGAGLGHHRPEVSSCADLTRSHIEDYNDGSAPGTATTAANH